MILFPTIFENNILNAFNRQILVFHEVAIGNQILLLHILKDVRMTNQAASELVCLVIRPLSIRSVVHVNIKR